MSHPTQLSVWRPTVLLLACLIGMPVPAIGATPPTAGTPIEIGRSFHVQSRILGESRIVDVSLPDDYEASATRYPVLLVLDGEFEGEIAAAIAHFYAGSSQLPQTIVAAVHNTDRTRDMTPVPMEGFTVPAEAQTAGGADRFLEFLADELLPYLDARYRTAPMRVLIGHSLGGLFALHALAQRPELFTGYLVMEPSVWWNNGRELEAVRDVLRRPQARRARLMLINTEPLGADTTRWGGTAPMVRQLRTTGETHASMAPAGMLQGLRTLFADFKPAAWRPGTRPVAMLDSYDSLAARVGYAVPIPEAAFAKAVRMSIDSRYFEDAERALDRMERHLGVSDASRSLRDKLASVRATPQPDFIPLVIPPRRPTPQEARAFLGRWLAIDQPDTHEVEVRAAGDTVVVHDRLQFANGEWYEADDPVIQVTADGTLEWGLPWFRGIAALLVLRGRVTEDGTMIVSREPRGWVPRGSGPDLSRNQRFRRVTP